RTGELTKSIFLDFTGDGRPDVVYQKDGSVKVVPNVANGDGSNSFGAPLGSFTAFPGAAPSEETLGGGGDAFNQHSAGRKGRTQDVWRQMIDFNGDGRLDLVVANEQEATWFVYLNTPATFGGITWSKQAINVQPMLDALRASGHEIPTNFLPLSRTHSGIESSVPVCVVWDSPSNPGGYIEFTSEDASDPLVQQCGFRCDG